jgi:hypothetical protein
MISDTENSKALVKTDVSSSVFLQIGMQVLIKNEKGYLKDKNTVKTITADLPNYNGKRAFELDNDRGEIWQIEDFEKCVNYPNLVMR